MSEESQVDVVVLGGGPPGENVAERVRAGGLSCALVEVELFGGECSYWACIPSKALLRPIEIRAAATRLPGIEVGPLDGAAVLKRRDSFTGFDGHRHDDTGQVQWVEGTGSQAVRGHGRLDGTKRVVVQAPDGSTQIFTARHAVVLAVGSDAAVPPVPGLAEAKPWTSRDATSSETVPRRLAVLGGGVVACEMAQAYHGLGAEQVTIIEIVDRLLTRQEPFAGELLAQAFTDAGIAVRTGVKVTAVKRPEPGGEITLEIEGGDVVADEVLVATGRRPRTHDLGVETVGLQAGRYVDVDDWLTVSGVEGDWLYAVGDVNGRSLLTHMGKYQARLCGDVVVRRARGEEPGEALRARADRLGAPSVVFTDPQVASVGYTEADARAKGLSVRAVESDIGSVAGASLLADGYRGRASVVVDEDRKVVVGATFVGQDVAELLHSATVAVVGAVPLADLWHAVPSYPTISEIWLRLLEAYGL